MKTCCFVTLVLLSAIFLFIGVFLLTWLPAFIKSEIKLHMSLRDPDTQLYNNFVNQSEKVDVLKKFEFSNVTNMWEVVHLGRTPTVEIVGPYYYRRIRYRAEDEIWWQSNGTMRYTWNETYEFQPQLSKPKTDRITSVRVGVLFAFQTLASSTMADVRPILDLVVPLYLQDGIFTNRTVDELVTGYDEPFLKHLPGQSPLVALAFNHTLLPHSEIYDGSKSSVTGGPTPPPHDLGWFTMYRGMRNLSKYWITPETQELRGTDGSIYAPLMSDESEITAFVEPMRRPVVLAYKEDKEIDGITVRRFQPRADAFVANEVNKGYRIFQTGFQPKRLAIGVPNHQVYGCITKQYYLDCNTTGMHVKMPRGPDRATDETHLEFEPHTGTLMRVRKRSQLNFRLQPMTYDSGREHVAGTVLLNSTWLPYMMETEEMDLPASLRSTIKDEVIWPLRLYVPLGVTFTCLGALVLAVAVYFRSLGVTFTCLGAQVLAVAVYFRYCREAADRRVASFKREH